MSPLLWPRYRDRCSCYSRHSRYCSCSYYHRRSTLATATDFALGGSRDLLTRILHGRRHNHEPYRY